MRVKLLLPFLPLLAIAGPLQFPPRGGNEAELAARFAPPGPIEMAKRSIDLPNVARDLLTSEEFPGTDNNENPETSEDLFNKRWGRHGGGYGKRDPSPSDDAVEKRWGRSGGGYGKRDPSPSDDAVEKRWGKYSVGSKKRDPSPLDDSI
ncbi:hypothetical protein H2200_005955 [Cladophialophora chaetospira]|uniref:Uncharacterized protein n=1 Tax=Cladophialophora chaetospira TaxID=386627 RepID=A0AA39CIW8_9EURO|nr:hypothetical protein H2200_005955 [Cladophialophora chaetospira]